MTPVVLENTGADGKKLKATFLPLQGMNLISYKKGDVEIIDTSTKDLFEDRYAGLGALIGPHFHHRPENQIPPVPHEERFPYIARLRAKGATEFFSHGIARYAPWRYEKTAISITGRLQGSDTWHDVPLRVLEGQDFSMHFAATLTPNGLDIAFSVEAERPSIVGLHYYYAISKNSFVEALVEPKYCDKKVWKEIPAEWKKGDTLHFDLSREADYGFRPLSFDSGDVLLKTADHSVRIHYTTPGSDKHCWQLYHPKDASFACIEPLTAKDPRSVVQKSSSLRVLIHSTD